MTALDERQVDPSVKVRDSDWDTGPYRENQASPSFQFEDEYFGLPVGQVLANLLELLPVFRRIFDRVIHAVVADFSFHVVSLAFVVLEL